MIADAFKPEFVHCFDPVEDTYEEILAEKYDYIMFTGSQRVGKIIMEAASQHLTPLTLELGGKSPCIVEQTADLRMAQNASHGENSSTRGRPAWHPTMCMWMQP
jgi:aldehyde dehydrogenase (NAD+)